jgi:hypothetical protein
MAKRNLNVKVVNQLTTSKDWQRLQKVDEMICDVRKRARSLYQERIELVGRIYNGRDADHGSGA